MHNHALWAPSFQLWSQLLCRAISTWPSKGWGWDTLPWAVWMCNFSAWVELMLLRLPRPITIWHVCTLVWPLKMRCCPYTDYHLCQWIIGMSFIMPGRSPGVSGPNNMIRGQTGLSFFQKGPLSICLLLWLHIFLSHPTSNLVEILTLGLRHLVEDIRDQREGVFTVICSFWCLGQGGGFIFLFDELQVMPWWLDSLCVGFWGSPEKFVSYFCSPRAGVDLLQMSVHWGCDLCGGPHFSWSGRYSKVLWWKCPLTLVGLRFISAKCVNE